MEILNWVISNWVWSPLPWAVCRSGGSVVCSESVNRQNP